jgi:hypothetical protein
MDAAIGNNDSQIDGKCDRQSRNDSTASDETMPVVFDEAFRAGIECFGHLLKEYGLTRDNMRILRSFADVVSATALRCSKHQPRELCLKSSHDRKQKDECGGGKVSKTSTTTKKKSLEEKSSIRAAKTQRYLAWKKVQDDPSNAAREELRKCAERVKERKRNRTSTHPRDASVQAPSAARTSSTKNDDKPAASVKAAAAPSPLTRSAPSSQPAKAAKSQKLPSIPEKEASKRLPGEEALYTRRGAWLCSGCHLPNSGSRSVCLRSLHGCPGFKSTSEHLDLDGRHSYLLVTMRQVREEKRLARLAEEKSASSSVNGPS